MLRRLRPLALLLVLALAAGPGALLAREPAGRGEAPAPAAQAALAGRVERAIADGSVFARSRLRPEALQALDAYRRGDPAAFGKEARLLAPRLDGRSVRQFMMLVRALAKQEGAAHSRVGVRGFANQKQTMEVWEFPDGTVVRYKPKGDPRRNYPTFSIEVKDTRQLPNAAARQEAVAFKVDPRGRAVPSTPRQVNVPDDVPRSEVDDWIDLVMEAGHRPLKLY